ncbi:MAG: ferredoxin [Actinomycetota bacterium]|nr:ferredoxin [Actinomycetota bacterium]
MKIHADTDRCVGAGQCVLTAPDIFDQDDEAIVIVLDQPGDAGRDLAQSAADRCPAGAISVDAEGMP